MMMRRIPDLSLLSLILVAVVQLAQCSGLSFRKGRHQAVTKSSSSQSRSGIPLKLEGASCSDPPVGLPKYCCNGILINPQTAETCECNPGWTAKECTCKGIMLKRPCHHCMVHLPATNRWTKTFKHKELYANCEDCVSRCQEELKAGYCAENVDDVLGNHFVDAEPAEVICTNGHLKDQVMKEDYPLGLKRELYREPTMRSDNDMWQDHDWDVPGVR